MSVEMGQWRRGIQVKNPTNQEDRRRGWTQAEKLPSREQGRLGPPHGKTSRALRGNCHQASHYHIPATLHFIHTHTHTCPGTLGVSLSAGPGSRLGNRLRGLACRLLLPLIVRLPSSCSLGLKVSSSGGLVTGRLRYNSQSPASPGTSPCHPPTLTLTSPGQGGVHS